jgi:hypothetical protein
MDRDLLPSLQKDLLRKAVFLAGPRQCGKTYLSRQIGSSYDYLNFDIPEDRKRILKKEWYRDRDLVIFDEIHKMKKWKIWLKGVLDSDRENQQFLVTGSAKLNTYKKVGDSLAGRYFSYRLYPFDLKEILNHPSKEVNALVKDASNTNEALINRLLEVSGFPEPFLVAEKSFYQKWRQTHLDVILKQDILETESVKNIKQLETLAFLLTEKVGSLVSYNSLREDLSTDDKSIKRWVDILENSYVLFRIYPFSSKSLIGGLKKAPKVYFFDIGRIESTSARIENLVALSLMKEIHRRMDVEGEVYDLSFIRNKQQMEIDFLITKNKKPHLMIEVKESDANESPNLSSFRKYFNGVPQLQLVKNLQKGHKTKSGVHVQPLSQWLAKMEF